MCPPSNEDSRPKERRAHHSVEQSQQHSHEVAMLRSGFVDENPFRRFVEAMVECAPSRLFRVITIGFAEAWPLESIQCGLQLTLGRAGQGERYESIDLGCGVGIRLIPFL